jgi:hypothetical protein
MDMPIESVSDRHARFKQFVYDLLLEDTQGWQMSVYQHVFSMARILTELDKVGGRRLTAYLPSLDSLSTDFPVLVEKQCPSVLSKHRRDNLKVSNIKLGGNQHKSSEDPEGLYQAAKDVWAQGGPEAKSLCVLHAIDYACWTELPQGVPDVCREVFESPSFTQPLLMV